MDDDFEKGKKQLIEGIDGFMKLYEPLIKIFEGMKRLGIEDLLEGAEEATKGLENLDALKIVLYTWLQDVGRAKNKEEVRQAIEKNRDLLKRLF